MPLSARAVIAFAARTSNATGRLSTEPGPAAQPPRAIGLTHATVIDVVRGTRLRDHTVIIEGGRIATVGPSSQVRVPDGYGEVNVRGKFIIPGLIVLAGVQTWWRRR